MFILYLHVYWIPKDYGFQKQFSHYLKIIPCCDNDCNYHSTPNNMEFRSYTYLEILSSFQQLLKSVTA